MTDPIPTEMPPMTPTPEIDPSPSPQPEIDPGGTPEEMPDRQPGDGLPVDPQHGDQVTSD